MKKVMSYLKSYGISMLCCFAFLFIQAFCDLSLPNYMSNIVNVGIQQNGIENSAPKALSQNAYTLLSFFMDDSEKQTFSENYKLTSANTADKTYLDEYPLLKTQDIYILMETASENIDNIWNAACFSLVSFLKANLPQVSTSTTDFSDVDFSQVYQLIPQLQALPLEGREAIRSNTSSSDSTLTEQSAVYLKKQIYSELGVDIDSIQNNYIVITGVFMLLLTIVSIIASIFVNYISSRVATKTARKLRHDVFRKVEGFSNNEFNRFSISSLITRTTNDITQVQILVINGIRSLCYAPIVAIGGIIMALEKSVSMSWTIFLGIAILIMLIICIFILIFPKFNLVQKLVDKFNLVTKENLTGIMVIRAFGTQKFEEKRFDEANRELTQTDLFNNRIMAIMYPAMTLLMNLISVIVIWTGSYRIEQSQMQVGDMMAFMQYATQIIMSFLMISIMFIMVPRAMVSAKRIAEVLSTESTILEPESPNRLSKSDVRGKVEFRNVSFRYGDAKENILENISFTAFPGQTTAFIGPTGSGKSTLINLIPRFFDVTDGEILIDDVNIKYIPQSNLHEFIGYVPQKGMLFSGDIESNLKYGDENASAEELQKAIEVAQATEFVNAGAGGFSREISQSGKNVSGGQRQRLSIARAIIKNAPIYIFDDSFSALDLKTDAALRKALSAHTKKSTILIVAQRISTIMNAEQIVVLDGGHIVGLGTHKELLKSCDIYREIAQSQLPKEELA